MSKPVKFFKLQSKASKHSLGDWEEIWRLNADGSYSVIQYCNNETKKKERYDSDFLVINPNDENDGLKYRIALLKPLTEQEAFIELL